jgi:phosphatidate cytidylyltransferase
MHLKRLIVAAVLLPPIYLYILYLPPEYFLFLVILISSLALTEFYSMYNVSGILKYACFFFGVSILGVSFFFKDQLLNSIIVSVITIMVVRLLIKRDPVSSLSDISAPVVGLVYIPVLCSFQMQIRQSGPEWIIFLYGTVWASDSMAYYIGKGMGRKKLYKEVSPNKTVEGAAGSFLGGAIGAIVLKLTVVTHLSISSAVFIGIMIGVVAIIGDLVESMFKRDAGMKDSGVIIPGHGGMLDKLDGVLFAGPVLYWILTAMEIAK